MASRPASKAKKAPPPPAAAKKSAAAKPESKPASKSAPPPVAAKKKPAETVSLKGVFEELAAGHDLPKKQANLMLNGLVERITMHLKNGARIRMNGLGILEVRDRPARQGRNPATGESIQLAASKKVAFRPAKELKEAV